ncbi:hypothetical protein D3C85_1588470 [compost metagenome]
MHLLCRYGMERNSAADRGAYGAGRLSGSLHLQIRTDRIHDEHRASADDPVIRRL